MNKNFTAFTKLKLADGRRFTPGEYVVVSGGKLFRKGKSLEKYLSEARSKYPNETPLVAKVPHKSVFV